MPLKPLTNFERYRNTVLRAVEIEGRATVRAITGYTKTDDATARRVADKLVKPGKLTRTVKRFWNGMHYTNRFHYELPKKEK